MITALIAVTARVAILLAATWLVHRDATRVGVSRPLLWAGVVFATTGVALATHLLVATVPLAGLLVIALAGPAFYLFERDDSRHGGEPADPHALPGDSPGERPESNGEE